MSDVAHLAGVSIQTVSRVVNRSPAVSPAARSRVLQSIEQLGYRTNALARTLATGRSTAVGVVSADRGNRSVGSLVLDLGAVAADRGCITIERSLDRLTEESALEAVNDLRAFGVAGLVALDGHDAVLRAMSTCADVPSVALHGRACRAGPGLGVDDHDGGRIATQHLIDLGHRDVAHLGGPPQWAESSLRRHGWEQALQQAGRPAGDSFVGDWTVRSGYEQGLLIAARPEVSAVFCANDAMAMGLLLALAERGRAVPDDVAVVGFGDAPESAYLIPPLTTVRPELPSLAEAIVDLLVGGSDASPTTRRPGRFRLVHRASSAEVRPPRGTAP